MDIFSIVILFFVVSTVFRFIKKASVKAQNAQQAQAEAGSMKPTPVAKPVAKPQDFRFPPVQKPAPTPTMQEDRKPDAAMGEYTPITPSADLANQFSAYEGSLGTSSTEGDGYETEPYDPIELPYSTDAKSAIEVLPESFNRNTLLQAVVMSEILKRPGVKR